jgi:hypothetical protein
MGIKRYLLFTAPKAGDRKQFVASFETREEGANMGAKLKGDLPMRWQVVDSADSKVVAEHAGSEEQPAES